MTEDADWTPIEEHEFVSLVGPVLKRPARDGRGAFRFTVAQKHLNRGGVVHGGMLMTFADQALANTVRQEDEALRQATIQLDVHFVRGARLGETVKMTCEVVRETRSLVFVEGVMTAGGEIVATAKGIWKISARSDPAQRPD